MQKNTQEKYTFFIIHGTYGNPKENWFPWLAKKLRQLDQKVIVPKFPTPKGQELTKWKNVLQKHSHHIHKKTIFIGHSIAPAFILSVLEEVDTHIRACFFISGFVDFLGDNEIDERNRSFVDKKFKWSRIKNNCNFFKLYHSDNDPYVPLKLARNLTNKLETQLTVVKNAGHFNTKTGYKKFPKLLKDIQKNIL
jgi:predicted alpha/beta hydrolase family esterase